MASDEENEAAFNAAVEKLKEGAAEGEKSPTCISHDDCKILLQGLDSICKQRNFAQEALNAMGDPAAVTGEVAALSMALNKALDTIQKMACNKRGR